MGLIDKLCGWGHTDYSSGEEVEDSDAENLSDVAKAAYDLLRRKHNNHHHELWNVTSAKVVGNLHQTPLESWPRMVEFEDGHDDWFPTKIGEIISRTEVFCDVMSLGPPDGKFLDEFKKALAIIAENAQEKPKPTIVRMMFGNIIGMPVNCTKVIKALTKDLPSDANMELWVGAWRKGVSWNHAKIVAVDGHLLWTGGHNLWDAHYLKNNPVHDLSLEMEGRIAHDGHQYANAQWAYIERKQSTIVGQCIDKLPDSLPIMKRSRVTVSEWPSNKAAEFPPLYRKRLAPLKPRVLNPIRVISMGRYGVMNDKIRSDRPSDDAFIAMFDASQTIIRLALQDLGPVCIPGTKMALPGCKWPKNYLRALGRAIYERGVDVEIALSNPNSIPGGLKGTEANYGNGWSCVDVAAEIIKTIKKAHDDVDDDRLRQMVTENLRVCFIRQARGNEYDDGKKMGMHAKHFIVDDKCCYIGSQNLYVCDLAEWGVLIDSEEQTKTIMDEYWHPLWKSSYTGDDVDVQAVMDGLDIDRDGEDPGHMSEECRKKMEEAGVDGTKVANHQGPVGQGEMYGQEEEEE